MKYLITAGIDIGIRYTKVVILKDGDVAAHTQGVSGGIKRRENADRLWREALEMAGLKESDVQAVFSTGKGKYNTDFSNGHCTEIVAMTKALQTFYPQATMGVNLGADEILVSVLDKDICSGIAEMAQNQKCSAGLGLLIENVTEEFGWDYEQTSQLQFPEKVTVSDGCAVFARMDILEARNRGASKEAIMEGTLNAAAVRANSVIRDITFPNTDRVVLCGGLSKNKAFVRLLKEKSKIDFEVSDTPEYICAIGAALAAEEKEKKNAG